MVNTWKRGIPAHKLWFKQIPNETAGEAGARNDFPKLPSFDESLREGESAKMMQGGMRKAELSSEEPLGNLAPEYLMFDLRLLLPQSF